MRAPAKALSAQRPAGRALWIALVGVVVLAGGLYARTVDYDYTDLDDNLLITNDLGFLTRLSNLPRVFARTFFRPSAAGEKYYRPVVAATFVINASMSDGKPWSFHVTNVILHMAATALCLLLLLRLGHGLLGSSLAAGIFAVHPVLAGAVAWIPGRVYVLLAICSFGSMLALLRWVETRQRRWLVVHALLLAGALLCQEAAIVLPFLWAAWLWLDRQRRRLWREPVLWITWGVVLVGWFVVWSNIAGGGTQKSVARYLGALIAHLPALLIYLGKIVLPHRLSVLPIIRDGSWVAGAVTVIVVALLATRLRGVHRARFAWGVLWFLASIVPSLPVSDFVILESRLYVPSLGLLVMGLALAGQLAESVRWTKLRQWGAAGCGLLIVLFAARSWAITAAYRDRDAFTKQAVESSPHAALAHQSRGFVLFNRGDYPGAEHHFRQAVTLSKTVPVVNGNLGAVLLVQGKLEEAQKHLEQELMLNPGNAQAHYNLATTLLRRGNRARGIEHLRLATDFDPTNVQAWGELLQLYAASGNWVEAERCRKAMESLGVRFTDRPR